MNYPQHTKFLLTGLGNTIFGFFVYAFLIYVGLPYIYSVAFSILLGIIFNYFSYSRFVFRKRFNIYIALKYVSFYFCLYFFNIFLVDHAVVSLNLNFYISQLFALPFIIISSWFCLKFLVFR